MLRCRQPQGEVLSDNPGQTQAGSGQPQTENSAPPVQAGRDISSLENYRARQAASSAPKPPQPPQAGGASPNTGADSQADHREQAIPRPRFDEVNAQKNQYQQQVQALQAQIAQMQQAQQATGMQGAPVQPQGYAAPSYSGMQGAAPQQAGPKVPDFNDPAVQKQWREKITNNPVTGLREFVSLLIQAEGAPLLQQFQQQILGQITPIQQTFVQQQLSSYESSRTQSDPTFSQVAPTFRQLAVTAQQRGFTLTPQTLQAIEGIARAQAGIPFGTPPAPAQAPFSERPGGGTQMGQAPTPTLTPQQRDIARRFGMTEQEYAASLMSLTGGNR